MIIVVLLALGLGPFILASLYTGTLYLLMRLVPDTAIGKIAKRKYYKILSAPSWRY